MAINIGDYFSLGSKNIFEVPAYQTETGTGGLLVILSVIVRNIYIIAAIILLIFIFIGGLGMILNAGNAEKQKQSSQTLSSAVTGFFILFTSYWIIKLIELILGVRILSLTT